MSLIFILSGVAKITGWGPMLAYFTERRFPLPSALLGLVIFAELGGGLALLFGYRARFTAFLLFLYLIPVTLLMNNFWIYQSPEAELQLVNFLKNLAIMGGLLILATSEPARKRARRPRSEAMEWERDRDQQREAS